ncbi:hybrid sensor histidine kinase/response regulator transcription factor [Chitinophaga cymbidii]|uniref:histidine kinase n=1 Tax=Chitinophaga cymbidii TaxID=1096750 RepID=A0A512RSJ9_9BACT|nr:hybrid sensor histidine kinase/response regulator transcription factor [Chitinophaga cymbidii]GEP98676.1 hybrid sensor histidine kinase/response regulator [Chitinophaga cymbidii]
MPKYIYTPLFFILTFLHAASAQTAHINFTALSSKDGLLSNSVNAIIKDQYGLMWFATDDGLNKFDGTNFTVYRHIPGDTGSLRANEILALHEDKAGNLWIGTSGGGLSRYDRKKDIFIHYAASTPESGPLPNAVIRSICSDDAGMVWIAQYERLFRLDPASGSIFRLDLAGARPASMILTCVLVDSRQRVWTGTNTGLYLYDRTSGSIKCFRHDERLPQSLISNDVRAIAEDRDGNIWIGTMAGLCTYRQDGAGFNIHHRLSGATSALSSNEIACIVADEKGDLWVGTAEGLSIIHLPSQTITNHVPRQGHAYSLTSKTIRCAYIDQQSIYWLGTFRGGINKYDPNLNLFDIKPGRAFTTGGRPPAIISAFAEDGNGSVFVGTEENGLFRFNPRTEQISPVTLQSPAVQSAHLTILALLRSRNNKLYAGTYANGLFILDPATGSSRHLEQGAGAGDLSANDIFCMKEDRKGRIWIGTNGQGINLLQDEKVVKRFTPYPRPGAKNETLLPINGYIRAIEEDAEGNIWIGTHGGGMAVYNPENGEWKIYTQSNSRLPSDKVQALLPDSHGNMWVGTYGEGLSMFDKKLRSFINFSEKDGLQNTTIYHVLEDLNGLIWVSTNTGISSFDPVKKKFRNFTYHNGVQNNNFVHASGIRLSGGELMFGGLDGFNYFDPALLTVNRNVPVVLLTDLKVSNKSVAAGDDAPIKEHISVASEIRLAYKQNFSLGFVALNYTIPKQNHYAYRLEGFDKDWNYTGTVNTASYTNLDPGEYTFHVKAGNNDGVWSTKDTVIKIYVLPPFWRTIYAYIFYIAAAGGLLLYSRHRGITRLRKKFLLEQEREEAKRIQELDRQKIKFLTNLSHDFRTPISLIMGPVDQLIAGEKADNRLEKLGMVKRNARRLLNLVNQLLDFRKMEEHELQLQLSEGEWVSFVKEVTDSFRDFAEKKHIRLKFSSRLHKLDALFDHDKMERILFNLLSNAFKFTLEDGSVIVELQEADQQWVCIKITDTGIGIPRERQQQVFDRFYQATTTAAILNQGTGIGLSITREFVRLHGGTIGVESEEGKGAVFFVRIPLMPVPAKAPQQTFRQAGVPASTEMTEPSGRQVAPAPAEAPAATADMPLVLLVEDNEDFRIYLKDNLCGSCKVIEAADGKEGWQKALALHPELIVSDISMPQMDGISLLQKLKADKRTSHIPVILLTALANEEQQIAGLETGANDYITKPFNSDVLYAKIRNLLQLNHTLKNTYSRQVRVLAPEAEIESAGEKLMNKIAGYLEDNLASSQLSVESLSKEVGMSRSSLYSRLLELTGQTPVEYIRSYRLERAAALMEKSEMTIAEIAYLVGFSTPNYFAKSFKSKFNMLPSEFIASMKKSDAGSHN